MSGTVRAASMRTRSSAFSSTLTSMMTSRRPSGRFWMSRATAMRISRISASVTAADGTARRSSRSTSPMSFACSTMFPRASPAFLTSKPLPVSCSCQTMTWAMAVTCSAPAKAGPHPAREAAFGRLFLCPVGTGPGAPRRPRAESTHS